MVIITYKNNKKKCEFFVVPRNDQVLLGMLDTVELNIINVNIDSIETACMQKANCITNMIDAKTSNTKQETHGEEENCTNSDEDLKNVNNVSSSDSNTNTDTLINYFLPSPNIEIDKRKNTELTQKNICLIMFLMALGALKPHFCYS